MTDKEIKDRFSEGFNQTMYKLFVEDHQQKETFNKKKEIRFYSLFPKDRYFFDFNMNLNEWMQLDTGVDAHYFGNWINPSLLATFSYIEGDTYLTIYEDMIGFKTAVKGIIHYQRLEDNYRGIDPGLNPCDKNMAFLSVITG